MLQWTQDTATTKAFIKLWRRTHNFLSWSWKDCNLITTEKEHFRGKWILGFCSSLCYGLITKKLVICVHNLCFSRKIIPSIKDQYSYVICNYIFPVGWLTGEGCIHETRLWFLINSRISAQVPCREQPACCMEYSQSGQLSPEKIYLRWWRAKWGDDPTAPRHPLAPGEKRDSSFFNNQRESRVPQHC